MPLLTFVHTCIGGRWIVLGAALPAVLRHTMWVALRARNTLSPIVPNPSTFCWVKQGGVCSFSSNLESAKAIIKALPCVIFVHILRTQDCAVCSWAYPALTICLCWIYHFTIFAIKFVWLYAIGWLLWLVTLESSAWLPIKT